MEIEKIARRVCQNFKPYIAGKSIESLKKELGLRLIIKLASNENPLGISHKVIKAIRVNLPKVFFYPDSNACELKKNLSDKYVLPVDNIFLGAGSDEIIELIARVFFTHEDEIIISKHSFTRYAMAIQLMEAKAVVIPMRNDLTYDLRAIAKTCNKHTKAIFITNPNNPTGTYNTKHEFLEFLENLTLNKFSVKPLVILDEAYFEYASLIKDYPNSINFLERNPNLIILRTFSKIYGLAGLRVAYGFASKIITNYIEKIRPPFNVNSLAQVAASAAIMDEMQIIKSQKYVEKEKKYLYEEFSKLKIKYVKSVANFILFSSLPLKGNELFKKLLREGVIIRAMDEYELPFYVRVTIGLHKENKLFIKKLRKIICIK
ncbi:MAG: histidinol-phosphate transaminase [Endomicrobium sp.]|jgi:histidinol-phosphate aminotransferase|nr:histidinol-phosphate transaminase [Endomicrobium sp.]